MAIYFEIYLRKFVQDLKEGGEPKRAIIFVKKYEDLFHLDEFLTSELGHLDSVKDPNTSPWVISYSGIGQNAVELIRKHAMEEYSFTFPHLSCCLAWMSRTFPW